jgi:hypothetical protein
MIMKMNLVFLTCLLSFALAAVACGGGAPTPPSDPTSALGGDAGAPSAPSAPAMPGK